MAEAEKNHKRTLRIRLKHIANHLFTAGAAFALSFLFFHYISNPSVQSDAKYYFNLYLRPHAPSSVLIRTYQEYERQRLNGKRESDDPVIYAPYQSFRV
jgi:hypothetical protein